LHSALEQQATATVHMRIQNDELARRAAIWAATLRDDATSLRERARSPMLDAKSRRDLLQLAAALNRAAKVLDGPAGQIETKPRKRKKA
jgi:hypothetical protein